MKISIRRHGGTPLLCGYCQATTRSSPTTRLHGRARSQEISLAKLEPDDGKDSDRRAVSRREDRRQLPFLASHKRQAGTNVFTGKVEEVFEHVLFTHPGGKVLQYVIHGHAETTDAGLATALLRISNAALPIHIVQVLGNSQRSRLPSEIGKRRRSSFITEIATACRRNDSKSSAPDFHSPQGCLDKHLGPLLRWRKSQSLCQLRSFHAGENQWKNRGCVGRNPP